MVSIADGPFLVTALYQRRRWRRDTAIRHAAQLWSMPLKVPLGLLTVNQPLLATLCLHGSLDDMQETSA